MMKDQVALLLLLSGLGLQAQNSLYIPPVLTGTTIGLTVDEGTHEFYPGMPAPSIGYNGDLLGPTLFLASGSQVQFTVQNDLGDTTTVHWHGLHVAPQNDGGPHSAILPGGTWSPSFTIMDKAGTYWYHPHPHGKTMEQVLKGAAGMIIVGDAEEALLPLPRTYGVDDIPLVLQFKGIDAQGHLIMNDEVDNEVLVNGAILPDAELPAQVVRLRLLNGSSMRTFRLGTTAGVPM
ncbi:MAG: multicopper oxidase domain-containing protein, partial [Flavobacteriales bacterium]|nr:multicopper oxidase domain-containing protein [Flavobacteriales bacterium]